MPGALAVPSATSKRAVPQGLTPEDEATNLRVSVSLVINGGWGGGVDAAAFAVLDVVGGVLAAVWQRMHA
jgi:hypothetical protein